MRPAWAAINLPALQHNLRQLRQQARGARVLAILKANAYGHGLVRIGRELKAADALGVARLDEALQLRHAGVTQPIVLLEGFFEAAQIPVLAKEGIQPVIHQFQQLEQLEQSTLDQPLQVWLKVDTGMHRLGFEPVDVPAVRQRLVACSQVVGEPVLMSHFACADESGHWLNEQQQQIFQHLQDGWQGATSLANSAALLNNLQGPTDWVRPGVSLYGVSPLPDRTGADLGLQPVMSLRAGVISTRTIAAGEPVGYGGFWRAPERTRLAIVAIGYGDGYPRNAPAGTPVWINGQRYPLVGRVAMDMATVDLGIDSQVAIGDTAELWGEHLPVEEVACHLQTIPYELLCNVARRVVLDYSTGLA